VGYVRKLEKALILTLLNFGLAGGQIAGKTGVWVQPDVLSRCPRCLPENRQEPAKIASIGVKVDRNGITRHGFALNVAPDMHYWEGIVPCGLQGVHMTSMAELLEDPPEVESVAEQVIVRFGEVFGYKMVKVHP
jgi:lipoate-protein ligase B